VTNQIAAFKPRNNSSDEERNKK